MTEDVAPAPDLVGLTADLVTAYVANNSVSVELLPGLIASIHQTLSGLGNEDEPAETHVPAVSVRKSLASRDHIVSLIDGKPYKSLTRHLNTHGLTPEEYRARYGLTASYPMVAPAYSEKRSALAKALGFGRKPTAKTPSKSPAKAPAKAGRKPRAKAAKAGTST
ncbi:MULTISPECIES: MucR family transcriptional regulator [Brevundimonas]|uniref:Transcriptional regulator n=1 Tax=Brevundimonas abyssalis TAR-001 TaxID=1391729 RepID=A0A8E0NDQ1_9CAUL|nr:MULTISPECIES: MucR family transcriptional regulator [Brevundimonas]GAD60510.1 transcriptional regulator [Brevundimonas abyssalis TAR-001]